MKKFVTLLAFMALMAVSAQVFGQEEGSIVEGSVATVKEHVEDVVKKNFEISTAVYGLFNGIYTVSFELSLADGLFGIGPKLTYVNKKIAVVTFNGMDALGVVKIYPALYRRGFYAMVQLGYTFWEAKSPKFSVKLKSIPMMAGFGFKWVINQFSFDLGAAIGKRIYTSVPPMITRNINRLPYNLAFDGYLLFGFRF